MEVLKVLLIVSLCLVVVKMMGATLPLDDISEREVDACGYRLPGFRHAMPPMVLEGAAHQQQTARGGMDVQRFAGLIVAYLKQPCRAQTQRGDERIIP